LAKFERMDKYTESNRDMWDGRVDAHAKSEFYDVESFKKGRCTLRDDDLKDVSAILRVLPPLPLNIIIDAGWGAPLGRIRHTQSHEVPR
jgi:hypothetical protein